MKREIKIWNGGGWNNYAALQASAHLTFPRGIKGLLAANKVTRLEVSPADEERPYGFEARFYRGDDRAYTVSFDQNCTAQGVIEAVMNVLSEGIDARVERRRSEIAAEALRKAVAAGYASAEEHQAALAAEKAEQKRLKAEQIAVKRAADEAAADAMFGALVLAIRENPTATRLSRAGILVRDANKHTVEYFGDDAIDQGVMRTWLRKNGFRDTIDDRHHLFEAAKNATDLMTIL